MVKKIALFILISVFLVGCATVSFKPLIPEDTIRLERYDNEDISAFQLRTEKIAKQELERGEDVEIRYAGSLIDTWHIKIYHYKEGEFQFADWKPKLSKDLQEPWKPKWAFITIYYRPCR